jgi:uracil-DNA glycosylase family protein
MRSTLAKGSAAPAIGDSVPERIPSHPTLAALREIARRCTACPLYAGATQTVFGAGPAHAALMLVGETPGDYEDREGRPFVGPAGRLLDRCLEAAGLSRKAAYVTNVVKHFKWVQRGKRRIHAKPNALEIRACKPWVQAEIRLVRPQVLVCMGATAAQALLGPAFRVTKERGKAVASELAPSVIATVHPSSLLRAPDADRDREIARFIADLEVAARLLKG